VLRAQPRRAGSTRRPIHGLDVTRRDALGHDRTCAQVTVGVRLRLDGGDLHPQSRAIARGSEPGSSPDGEPAGFSRFRGAICRIPAPPRPCSAASTWP
jgi:hypothetical protein